jgi:hypothetical protein
MTDLALDHLRDQVLMRLHREAMTCRDVEDLVRFLRILHQTMLRQMAEEQAAADAGKRGYGSDDALAWEARFQTLLPLFDAANTAVAQMERTGYPVDGKADLHQAELDLRGMLSVSAERLQRSAESIRGGRGRSLAEVRDGVQRRLHA